MSVALTQWARLIAETLSASGVRDVVVSPGSRSTPFLLAIAAHPRLRVTPVIDERAASFVALGAARATGAPVALLCTSGTAPAHWLPAVIEASLCELPLVCLSADRPFELAACGASQTIDQVKLFGDHARFFADLGMPELVPSALRGLRRTIAHAVARACGPSAGPVHLNLRARKPLEPVDPSTDDERAAVRLVDALIAEPLTRIAPPRVLPDRDAVHQVIELLRGAQRPILVAGPLPVSARGAREAALALALRASCPLAAETTSQLRHVPGAPRIDSLEALLSSSLAPDLVLELGATPTSSAYERFCSARPDVARVVLGASELRDPHGSARAIVRGELRACLDALLDALPPQPSRGTWIEHVSRCDARTWSAIERALSEAPQPTEGGVARALLAALPDGVALWVGNSLPVRLVDRFAPSGAARDLLVLSQRGAAGIDGNVASAVGASLALGSPIVALLGDVTLAHDITSLALAARSSTPVVLLVLDNGGGRIFEQLPVARAPELAWAMPLFTTPPSIDLEHAARAFGTAYHAIHSVRDVASALAAALRAPGATLLHVRVPASGAADVEARIAAHLARTEA